MKSNARFWLVEANPFDLPEPPKWWQRAVLHYDKMLRIMPSQVQRCYRLCRIARHESRLGMKLIGDVHRHPDTTAMINFGVVPELTLTPHAVFSSHIIGILRSKDNWENWDNDPNKKADAIEREERDAEAAVKQAHEEQWDEVLSDSFRHVKYGYRETVQAEKMFGTDFLEPLPVLPDSPLPRSLTRFDLPNL